LELMHRPGGGIGLDLQNEYPRPAIVASYAGHIGDAICKQSTKTAGQDGRREEEIKSPLKFVSFVPRRDQVQTSRE
jgi:hypothetical protein